MVMNMNWRTFLAKCDQEPGWKHLVEPTWIQFLSHTERYVLDNTGNVRDDYLTVCDDRGYGVMATWGTISIPHEDQFMFFEELSGFDWTPFVEPEFGNNRNWASGINVQHYIHHNPNLKPLLDLPISPSTLLNVYGLRQAFESLDVQAGALNSVLHWGAGYGNHSRIMRIWGLQTEYIIDLPLACLLQYEFLSRIFPGEVKLIDSHDVTPEKGKINIIPLPFRETAPDAELFIAIHSLNESTPAAQRYVMDRDFFSADKCIIAYTPNLKFEGRNFGKGVHTFNAVLDRLHLTETPFHWFTGGPVRDS
jgi:hypothetical protein